MKFHLVLPLLLLVSSNRSWGYLENDTPDSFSGLTHMSGYRYSDYAGFDKKWKLVTVRFRQDTGELRFTYANKLAWQTLMSGSADYPDGAVFGKVGYRTEEDPRFSSSAVPSGARRYQLMVRNKAKHKETSGWGYALFDGQGKTFPEDPKLTVKACASCHDLVPESGYVFSQPLDSSDALKSIRAGYKETKGLAFTFQKEKLANINSPLKQTLNNFVEAYFLSGNLRNHIFQGTLDEIIPTLMEQAQKTNLPAVLASVDLSRFTVVTFVKRACANGDGFEVTQTQSDKDKNGAYIIKSRVSCK